MSSFALNVRKWCDKAKADSDQLLRAVALEMLRRVVVRSPVGNPELWAANAEAVYRRQTFNLFAERLGERQLSPRTLAKKFPLQSGKGYVGGRFRGNWQVTFGTPAKGELKQIDRSGRLVLQQGGSVLEKARIGTIIFVVNNLPYAERLEYGWSKQAPAGMVRITVAEFQGIVNDGVKK